MTVNAPLNELGSNVISTSARKPVSLSVYNWAQIPHIPPFFTLFSPSLSVSLSVSLYFPLK